jgi:hypothetical protein
MYINLNTMWSYLGLTDFSFLGFLKINFVIIFILLLYYILNFLKIEQKEKENLETLSHVHAGITPEFTKIASLNTKQQKEEDMATAVKFINFVSEEKDEQKLLETINTDVKNSSIFNLDEFFKTLEKVYNKFDTMDGISQLAFSLVIQSSLIL